MPLELANNKHEEDHGVFNDDLVEIEKNSCENNGSSRNYGTGIFPLFIDPGF